MGDRVLIQFKRGDEVSPAIYGHNSGYDAPEALNRLRKRMSDRPEDIGYIAARCLQELGMEGSGSTGFGLIPADKELTKDDTHGDAGVFLVELGQRWRVRHLTGYAFTAPKNPDIEWVRS